MTTPVVTVSPDDSITDVGRLLLNRNVTAVPVVDGDGLVVGIVSRSDLLRGRVLPDPRAHLRPVHTDDSEPPHTVRDVMTQSVIALAPTDDEAEFTRVMLEHRIKSVPVLTGGRLVGLVSATDILRTKVRDDAAIERDVRSWLGQLTVGQSAWTVAVDDGVVTISGSANEPHQQVACLIAETVPGVVRARYVVRAKSARSGEGSSSGGAPSDRPTDHRGMIILSHNDCLERLRAARVGRLAFMYNGMLVILPVNHGVDGTTIVFRTTRGAKLHVAENIGAVAFEVDSFNDVEESGWSVLVKGMASRVYDDEDVVRYDHLGISAWVGVDDDPVWIRLRPDEITGRQIVPVAGRADAGGATVTAP